MDTTFPNDYRSATEKASDQISEAVTSVKDKAQDLGKMAGDKMTESRNSAANGLASAASTIHQKADTLPGGDTVHSIAHTTADKLAATADYVRSHEMKDVIADLEHVVRRNPGPSLLAAVAVGFMAGRMFREE
jgi:ElaB/YqjD/DUF883 family membrane-anchored ribosome-binding protein